MGHYRVFSFQQLSDFIMGKSDFMLERAIWRWERRSGNVKSRVQEIETHKIKNNGNFALVDHGSEINKKGQTMLYEVGGFTLADHGIEIKKNGIFTLADHGVEIKEEWQFQIDRS